MKDMSAAEADVLQ